MKLRNAERKRAKIKLGIQGPSGSGKTYSSLLMAYGITGDWSKIAVIDTENCSADLYANLGHYRVLNMEAPYSPEEYIRAIEICENIEEIEVVIIDSISHEWDGSGGIIETHGNMVGNSFTNWSKITPRHNAFVQKILQSRCHVIATIRSKQDYVLSEKNGKMVPEKVGLKGITRDGMDYEFTTVFDIDVKHNVNVSKDRTGLFSDKPQFVITSKTGQIILNWCNSGSEEKPLEAIKKEIKEAESVEELREIYSKYPEQQEQIKSLCVAAKNTLEMKSVVHFEKD